MGKKRELMYDTVFDYETVDEYERRADMMNRGAYKLFAWISIPFIFIQKVKTVRARRKHPKEEEPL